MASRSSSGCGRIRPPPTIPIVVLTSKTMTAEEKERLNGQISYLARKGEFDRAAFLELVRRLSRAPTRWSRRAAMAGELILIVEDNEKNMKLVRDLLQLTATRRSRPHRRGRRSRWPPRSAPDLILMDIQLPGHGRREALGRLRADPRTAAIPVCALTAFAMKDDRERFCGPASTATWSSRSASRSSRSRCADAARRPSGRPLP